MQPHDFFDIRPVFIGGCERSGTTMLASMLGSHRECLTIPEAQFVVQAYSVTSVMRGFDLARTLNYIKRHDRFRIWEIEIPSEFEHGNIASLSELILEIVKLYGNKVSKTSVSIWVDHTPMNVCYFSTLLLLFPRAKFVHIVRDGRAVTSSILRLRDWPYVEVDAVASLWLRRLACGLAAESYLGSEKVIRIKYEDLVQNPQDTLQTLCAFLGLPYESGMERGGGYAVPKYTFGQHVLVNRPPRTSQVLAWKEHLTPRQIEVFESITCDMLKYLQYQPLYGIRSRKQTMMERLVSSLRQLVIGRGVNRLRRFVRFQKSVAPLGRKALPKESE